MYIFLWNNIIPHRTQSNTHRCAQTTLFRSPWHIPHVSSASINRTPLMVCQEGRGDGIGPRLSHRPRGDACEKHQDHQVNWIIGHSDITLHRVTCSFSPAPCVLGCVPSGRSDCPRACNEPSCPSLTWPPTPLCLTVTHIHTLQHVSPCDWPTGISALITAGRRMGGGYHVSVACWWNNFRLCNDIWIHDEDFCGQVICWRKHMETMIGSRWGRNLYTHTLH